MGFTCASKTDMGLVRDHNEDSILVDADIGLFIVCDGMGGHEGGEVASGLAAEAAARYVRARAPEFANFKDAPEARERLLQMMNAAARAANAEVFSASRDGRGKPGMGTTLTMLYLVGRLAAVAHVGDSRLYLRRHGAICRMTSDHTYINEMIAAGVPAESLENSAYANVLSRAVGPQGVVQVDTHLLDVMAGDTFVLCSDGLHKPVEDLALSSCLDAGDFASAPERLVESANKTGDDNVSVILVQIDPEAAAASGMEDRLQLLATFELFNGLSMMELSSVVNLVEMRRCAASQPVFVEGESVHGFWTVLFGNIGGYRKEVQVMTFGPGEHFGEMGMFDGEPSFLTARALEPCTLLYISKKSLEALTAREPLLGNKLMWRFAKGLSRRAEAILGRAA